MKRNLIIIVLIFITAFGCKSPEPRKPKTVRSGSFIEESVKRNKALNQKETDAIKTIMANQPDNKYQASGNGFWYYYNTKVETDSISKITPEFGDVVTFNYSVKDLDGNTIYTKEELKTQHYAMDQQELFSGLREGLKLMQVGETTTFIFPSQKAYGYYGDENKIGTNIPIICEVFVHSITKRE
ncbi:MAG: gliding motility-associated peptidyl-prolyl isomerase GldI [Olleya sp.]